MKRKSQSRCSQRSIDYLQKVRRENRQPERLARAMKGPQALMPINLLAARAAIATIHILGNQTKPSPLPGAIRGILY